MRILITNDDGVHAEGIFALKEVAEEFGQVAVVAPDRERSACGHSMTMNDPLRVNELKHRGPGVFEVNGLPVDCVNVGLTKVYPEGCDLVLSGINHGGNLGYDITYSGTVGGAMEGAINGIRSIAVSMAVFVHDAPLHLDTAQQWLRENWSWLMEMPLNRGTVININVPTIAFPELNGHKVVPMGRRIYEDRVEERADPWGRAYFWQGGIMVMDSEQPGTDINAISQGYVSITPLTLDWTDHELLSRLSQHNSPLKG